MFNSISIFYHFNNKKNPCQHLIPTFAELMRLRCFKMYIKGMYIKGILIDLIQAEGRGHITGFAVMCKNGFQWAHETF